MPDAARIAQATVLEVPVTIQGSRTVEGSEQREPFIETAKTTLTFDDGAVLNLKARVVAGQSVFLRNDQSGKGIQCRVLEAPPEGEAGYTELEFTAPDPEFWGVHAEEPAPAGYASNGREVIEAPHESLVAVPNAGISMPTSEEVPAAIPETPAAPPSSPLSGAPLPEMTEALPEPADGAEPHDTKAAEQLAAMMAKESRGFLRRAFPAKEAKRSEQEIAPEAKPKQSQQEIKSEAAPKQGETGSETASTLKAFSPLALRIRGMCALTGKVNPITVGIAAVVLIAAVLGVAWHEKLDSLIHSRHRTSASSGASSGANIRQTDQPAGQQGNRSAIPVPAQPLPTPTSGVAAVAQTPAATAAGAGPAGNGKAVEESATSIAPKPAVPEAKASGGILSADRAPSKASSGQPKHQKSNGLSAHEIVPPKIVSQPQPSFPLWAKDLDVEGVVKLDALIDEKGNVTETKPLSGPRVLQHAAEGAVGLWIFEPAMSDGKPTATHMVLTVEFQR